MHVAATEIAVHQRQAGHPKRRKVVVVAQLPGLLPGAVVAGVVRVIGQGATTGAINSHPAIIAADLLQAHIEGAATVAGRKQRRDRAVIQIAGFGTAVFSTAEVTQIGPQGPVAQRLAVGHLQVLLLVDVLELGIPQADHRAFFVEGVFTADKVEAIGCDSRFALHKHVVHARVVARAVFAELPAIQRQAINVL